MPFLIVASAFVVPLIGFFAIRRFAWIALWGAFVLIGWVILLEQMQAQHVSGLGEVFLYLFIGLPSLIGALIGVGVTCFRANRLGVGEIDGVNFVWAVGATVVLIGLTSAVVSNL